MSDNGSVPFNDLSRIHRPLIDQFRASLTRLVESSSLVLGQEVTSFEQELSLAEGSDFAIGVNNGTSAIELTLRALGIGDGDEVITTAFTFVATCFSILQTGATPVLVDIDPLTGLLDPAGIERAITPKTKALVFVTLHGRVENLDQIHDICKAHNLRFVIDAAQSHLGTFNGRPQSEFCDAATLSFYPGKNLGALGEGGAILTNSAEVKDRLILMRDWGASEKYNHTSWGGNFRLESLQASFLRIKLRELKTWTQERERIAGVYRQTLNPDCLMSPITQESSHVFHIFAITVRNREEFCDHLSQNQIGFGFHYPKAIHEQPAYASQVLTPVSLSNAEYLAKTTISLPLFPGQSDSEVNKVIENVNQGLKKPQNY
jgi:dTDP-4-amino-4,6-dideoxygalactose transaminase